MGQPAAIALQAVFYVDFFGLYVTVVVKAVKDVYNKNVDRGRPEYENCSLRR